MNALKTVVFTGGGTAGHVTPNLALIDVLSKEKGWSIHYIGSLGGIEKDLINEINISYHAIKTGKLRRYFSFKTILDPFNIFIGVLQSYFILRRLKAHVVFSKGGFVAFPVVVGAWLNRIPVIVHESDMSPGLANRLSFPFANYICLSFDITRRYLKEKQKKVRVTGTPIRQSLFQGSREKGLITAGFDDKMPVLMVIGGSQGAHAINQVVRLFYREFNEQFQLIHLCGKGRLDQSLKNAIGYYQLDYAKTILADLFAASDIIVSRAGANSVCEIIALAKPHVFIPLPKTASRGDQLQNASFFEQQGISVVVQEEQLTPQSLLAAIKEVQATKEERVSKMKALGICSATDKLLEIIKICAGVVQ